MNARGGKKENNRRTIATNPHLKGILATRGESLKFPRECNWGREKLTTT